MTIILYSLACVFLFAVGVFAFMWFSIKNRGARIRLNIEHREPGYRGWRDPAPIPHPRYDIWLKIIGGLILFSGACGGVFGFVAAMSTTNETEVEQIPTRFVAAELTAEITPELIPTEGTTDEATFTPTWTNTNKQAVDAAPQYAFVVSTPTLDVWSTATPYPTLTAAAPIVERVVVTSRPVTIREPAPPPVVERVIVTSPPEVIYIPPIEIVVTATFTPTWTNTPTPTETATSTPTPTATATSTPTLTPQPESTDGL